MNTIEPTYLSLLASGELTQRVETAYGHLTRCDVCPLQCGVNRFAGELGVCKISALAQVSSFGPHHGEEDPIRGWRGSGTIFFSRCNLHCQYCQNATISQMGSGVQCEPADLAAMMLELQSLGCHNINFVSPSHVVPQILAGILAAAQAGLRIPIVYNSGGYDSLKMLALLDGVIDIYMPDMKYADEQVARKYSRVPDYPRVNQAAVTEMQRQVGDLQIDEQGLAKRGLLVRHLVLPHQLAGTETILRFLVEKVSKNVYLNLMDQYYPSYRAHLYPELNRAITKDEYRTEIQLADRLGLLRVDMRRHW